MYTNLLKVKLQNRLAIAGCIIQGALPAIAEICGLTGFDFVWVDAEHGPLSERECEELVRAAELRQSVPLIRVPSISPSVILRYLDVGAMGVIVPGINNKSDVESVVQAVKYYPIGTRGLTATRAADYGLLKPLTEYATEANAETLIFAIIETSSAIINLEEIMAVEGLDGAIFGGTDLSQALGVPGQWHHEKVQAAFNKFIDIGVSSGKPIGTVLRPGENAQELIDKGITIICANSYSLFANGAKSFVKAIKAKK